MSMFIQLFFRTIFNALRKIQAAGLVMPNVSIVAERLPSCQDFGK